MKLAICLYVDNLQHINYPVVYATEQFQMFDVVYWFGATSKQVDILNAYKAQSSLCDRIKVVNIDSPINEPSDIERGQYKCFEYMQNDSDADICAIQEADWVLTDHGVNAISQWIVNGSESAINFGGMQNKLYFETWHNPVVLEIHRKGIPYNADLGSWERSVSGKRVDRFPNTELHYLIDLGYLSFKGVYDKLRHHNTKLWPTESYNEMVHVYESGDMSRFFKIAYDTFELKNYHIITDTQQYNKIFTDLMLFEEYNKVKELI